MRYGALQFEINLQKYSSSAATQFMAAVNSVLSQQLPQIEYFLSFQLAPHHK